MKKVIEYIKPEVGKPWERQVYEYPNREEQMKAFDEIGDRLAKQMRAGEIATFQLEASK